MNAEESSPRIVVVGSCNTDMIVKAHRLPSPGETVLGEDLRIAGGGKGANQAVAAARLGAEVTLIGRVGNDDFGEQSLRAFRQEGICTDFVFQDSSRPSGVALIIVDDRGENLIAVASGANAALQESDVEQARHCIEQSEVLLLQLEVPLTTVRRAARLADEAKVRVILNPAPAAELDEELMKRVTVLTPNRQEAEWLSGIPVRDTESARQAARILMRRGAASVVITCGASGAFVSTQEGFEQVSAPPVDAVDTTAAGDTFNGALSCRLALRRSLREAVRFANEAAALSVTRMGAQPSMPTRQELEEFWGGR